MAGLMEWQDISTAPRDGTKIDLWAIGAEGEAERIPDVVWERHRFFSFSEGETKEYDGWICLC